MCDAIPANRVNPQYAASKRGITNDDAHDLFVPEVDGFNLSNVVDRVLGFDAAPVEDNPFIADGARTHRVAARLHRGRPRIASFLVPGG